MNHAASTFALRQLPLPTNRALDEALEALATAGIEARGAIFTRREVVDFILDLVGYTADKPLHQRRLLEPSFGGGNFLLPATERLIAAWKNSKTRSDPVSDLSQSLLAVELHRETFDATKRKLTALLKKKGIMPSAADKLVEAWLVKDDFLLTSLRPSFDFVVGNPPYVRQELIPDVLLAEYRSRFGTMYDRADLYVPFIEHSLQSLAEGGQLGFICADRWTKNRYGGPLRRIVAEKFYLRIYVDMVNTPAFQTAVIAYPAITIIARDKPGPTRIAHRPAITRPALTRLAAQLVGSRSSKASATVRVVEGVTAGSEPWILASFDQLALVRRLEAAFPTLEDAGCKVGIGVATGADEAFIGPLKELDVEPSRRLPLVMTRDILTGAVQWRGFGVVNPFAADGSLVNLDDYPRLKHYLEGRKAAIARRHCAQKAPANWYRTIDRIHAAIAKRPKLLIPDIKGEAHIVYEEGKLYPHHNLYYIISNEWDLKALQAVLLSGIARLFVSTYSTRMRGGYLRFQAQYLRRIRIPDWSNVPAPVRRDLVTAAQAGNPSACTRAAFELYGLNKEERAAIGGNGD